MIAFLLGLMIGFIMCIPVGPINIYVIKTLLEKNAPSALFLALGGSVMDFIYFMVILTGFSFVTFSDSTALYLKVAGVLFLFAMGIKELLVKGNPFADLDSIHGAHQHNRPSKVKLKNHTLAGHFLLGVIIYTSNPALVATMSGLAALIKSWNFFSNHMSNFFLLSLGLSIGSLGWFYFLIQVVEKYKHKIPVKFFTHLNRASGVIILIFSFYMAFNVYKVFSGAHL